MPDPYFHWRSVRWIEDVPREHFGQDLLYSFGAFLTICRIKRNNAEERIKAYESVFYLEALRNLYRTIQRVNNQFREPQMGAAMKEFRKVVSEDRIERMRGILNYQDEYTLGIGDAQKKNPHGDYEVWFQEDWDDETKTDFIVRVGEDFIMRISEVTPAAVRMADAVVRASFRSTHRGQPNLWRRRPTLG